MSNLKLNPKVPKQKHLEYFYQTQTSPVYSKDKTEKIDIGEGKTYDLPRLSIKTKTLGVPEKVQRKVDGKTRTYFPRKMFMEQNKNLKPIQGKFAPKAVKDRVKKAAKLPKMSFSTKRVKLIKPMYGKAPRSSF